ncbi:hypothetical protein Acr_13g0013290 [Actinidia rufa]|uniref:Uncharacterized protein n=1 Tax=Actinidia rufa TaxID=165716 RepID=A0A7J0FP32_9ERIC|nr:hypothetical protein Acr_13g0013290 [Actinidia rufa]
MYWFEPPPQQGNQWGPPPPPPFGGFPQPPQPPSYQVCLLSVAAVCWRSAAAVASRAENRGLIKRKR